MKFPKQKAPLNFIREKEPRELFWGGLAGPTFSELDIALDQKSFDSRSQDDLEFRASEMRCTAPSQVLMHRLCQDKRLVFMHRDRRWVPEIRYHHLGEVGL